MIRCAVILLLLSGCATTCPTFCRDYVNPVSCPKPASIERPVLTMPPSGDAAVINRALLRMLIDLEGYAGQVEAALGAYK